MDLQRNKMHPSRRQKLVGRLVLLLMSCACLVGLEIAYRAWNGAPLLALTDWRSRRILEFEAAPFVEHDRLLGWKHQDHFTTSYFNTIDFGIRKNRPGDQSVRPGGILVVGDSFASGGDVKDGETWPAQLEQILNIPVINAAVGGYGLDSITLRIEQLLPISRPKVVLVGTAQAIDLVVYSSAGWPKPYFTLENDRLVEHNIPVPEPASYEHWFGTLKQIASHSYLINDLMVRYAPTVWFSESDKQWRKVKGDKIKISCALLNRIKNASSQSNAKTVLVMQHGGADNLGNEMEDQLLIARCAQEVGIDVIDEYKTIHAIATNPTAFNELYIRGAAGDYGHMSPKGNRLIAEIVAKELRHSGSLVRSGVESR